jgi:hypothetical protein
LLRGGIPNEKGVPLNTFIGGMVGAMPKQLFSKRPYFGIMFWQEGMGEGRHIPYTYTYIYAFSGLITGSL